MEREEWRVERRQRNGGCKVRGEESELGVGRVERVEELGGRIEELKAVSACKIWSKRLYPGRSKFLEVGVSHVRWLPFETFRCY